MFIIQLQIVPDKVLLGNRDTFTVRKKAEEKTTKVDKDLFIFDRQSSITWQTCSNHKQLHMAKDD